MFKKYFAKMIAIILVIAMLAGINPMNTSVMAEPLAGNAAATEGNEPNADLTAGASANAAEIIKSENTPYIVSEVESRREEDAKYFRMSDGSYAAAQYAYPVHIKENNKWVDIDNSFEQQEVTVTEEQEVTAAAEQQSAVTDEQQFTVTDELGIASPVGGQAAGPENAAVRQTVREDKLVNKKAGQRVSLAVEGEKTKDNGSAKSALDKLVTIEEAGYALSWTYDDMKNAKAEVPKKEKKVRSGDERFLSPENLTGEVVYKNVFEQMDLQETVTPAGVKENLILNNKNAPSVYNITYNIGDLKAKQVDEKTVDLTDALGNLIYTICAPVMRDAAGAESTAVSLGITGNADGLLRVCLAADAGWITAGERVFPTTLDPVILTAQTRSNVDSTFVRSNPSNAVGNQEIQTYVGYEAYDSSYPSGMGICRSLIRINSLPALKSGDTVVGASLYVVQPSETSAVFGVADLAIDAVEPTSSWATTATWSSGCPGYNSLIKDYTTVNATSSACYRTWDVTSLVRGWYSGAKANNGIMLKAHDETQRSKAIFGSPRLPSNYSDAYPVLLIKYVNANGFEDYWSYTSMDNGRAGTASVNDFTGNAVYTIPLVSSSGNRMPINVSAVYNSNDKAAFTGDPAYRSMGIGYGWRLSCFAMIQSISDTTLTSQNYYYTLTDGDGTVHYFKSNGTGGYTDELNSNTVMTVNTSSTDSRYTVKYEDTSYANFSSDGLVTSEVDKNGNTTVYGHTGGGFINSITDPAGRVVQINYNVNTNQISTVVDVAKGWTMTLGYNTYGFLTSIKYPDSKIANIYYNSTGSVNNAVSQVSNYDSSSVQIYYYPDQRASYLVQMGANGSQIQKYTFTYNENATTVTQINANGDNLTDTTVFDQTGKVVTTYDNSGKAVSAAYDMQPNSVNKPSSQSKMQAPVSNLLQNGNGANGGQYWVTYSVNAGDILTCDPSRTGAGYYGNTCFMIQRNVISDNVSVYYQAVNLPAGTYTLSAWVKTSGMSGTDGGVYMHVDDGVDLMAASRTLTQSGGWQRLSTTFWTGSALPGEHISLIFYKMSGTAYFSNIQLESAATDSRYNLLDNGNFMNGGNPAASWGYSGSAGSSNTSFANYNGTNERYVNMNGIVNADVMLCQSVSINGKAGDRYVFNAWMMNNGATRKADSCFSGVMIGFVPADGSPGWQYIYQSIPAIANIWQYVSFEAKAAIDYKYVQVVLCLSRQVNNMQARDIQLFKEGFGASYLYNTSGTLQSATDMQNKTTKYEYGTTQGAGPNDLSKITYPDGKTSTFEYDSKHNITKATDRTNVVTEYTYDAYGNVTKQTVTGGGSKTGTTTYEYSSAYKFDYCTKVTDTRGNYESFGYDFGKGILMWSQDANGEITYYDYDPQTGQLLDAYSGSHSNISNNYQYLNDRLYNILHLGGAGYTFVYDGMGRATAVKVGGQSLITHTYNAYSALTSSAYGNGQTVSYTYNGDNSLSTVSWNGVLSQQYLYGTDGSLGWINDFTNDPNYNFQYDELGRVTEVRQTKSNGTVNLQSVTNEYIEGAGTANDRVNQKAYDGNNLYFDMSYDTDKEGRPFASYFSTRILDSFSYDELSRLTNNTVRTLNDKCWNNNYEYLVTGSGQVTGFVSKYSTGLDGGTGSVYTYTYDGNGNILTQSKDGVLQERYAYDSQNQLTRHDSATQNTSFTYTYDSSGNILYKYEYTYTTGTLGAATSTVAYGYGDSNWSDKLTSYNGKAITYDAIGNPLTYDGYTYSWAKGRTLAGISGNGVTASYKYNPSGIRTEKTVNGVTTKYYLAGSDILRETRAGTDLIYIRDTAGRLTCVVYNGVYYYYLYDLQGDVIGLIDNNGAKVVEYTYDVWGNIISMTGSLVGSLGVVNPYRYRGYRYDIESGLYYLNSRYYNPTTCRFINEDALLDLRTLQGTNLFSYCGNNPVNNSDSTGMFSGGNRGNDIQPIPGVNTPSITQQIPPEKLQSETSTSSTTPPPSTTAPSTTIQPSQPSLPNPPHQPKPTEKTNPSSPQVGPKGPKATDIDGRTRGGMFYTEAQQNPPDINITTITWVTDGGLLAAGGACMVVPGLQPFSGVIFLINVGVWIFEGIGSLEFH